jgi:hypothetical protein
MVKLHVGCLFRSSRERAPDPFFFESEDIIHDSAADFKTEPAAFPLFSVAIRSGVWYTRYREQKKEPEKRPVP